MRTEATGQSPELGFSLPAGIHRRQTWWPAGLRGVASILSGIASRSEPFDRHRARLTAWYEQFVQRSQPFAAWQPLTTAEWSVNETQSSFDSTQSRDWMARRESQMLSKDLPPVTRLVSVAQDYPSARHPQRFPVEQQRPQESFVLRRPTSGLSHTAVKSIPSSEPRAPELPGTYEGLIQATVQPAALPGRKQTAKNPADVAHSSREDSRLQAKEGSAATEGWGPVSPMAAPPQRYEERPLVRPAMRLAILRPITTVASTVQRKESGSLSSDTSGFSLAERREFPSLEHKLVEEQPAFQPRLVSSVSSLQRQEVSGGFPVSVKTEVGSYADTFSDDLVGVSVRDTSAFRNHGSPESGLPASSRHPEISEAPTAIPSVMLPGLQVRLLKPDEAASATHRSANSAAEGGRSTSEAPRAQALPPAAPPQLDINAVADKVYQVLQRRHQLERERRGLY
jgi:hypothetical protein